LKEALQAEVGLPVDRSIPLIGFIGRLEEQKGSDILVEAIAKFIDEDVQIIVLVSVFLDFFVPFSDTVYINKTVLMIHILFTSGNWQKDHGEAN
jgi:glycosyltransferase involved in cell wall biosynthesis